MLSMIYLEIYNNYSHKINIINFMECFTKILSIFFKGVLLKKIFLWNEPLRKIGFVKKSVLNSKIYLKSIRADKKKLCIFRKFCQLG